MKGLLVSMAHQQIRRQLHKYTVLNKILQVVRVYK
jgi:hypothetical protein